MAFITFIVVLAVLASLFLLMRAMGSMGQGPSPEERMRHSSRGDHTPGPRASGLN